MNHSQIFTLDSINLLNIKDLFETLFDVQIQGDLESITPSSIFTKQGDHGTTRLLNGHFISKGNIIIKTSGAIQLLSAFIGECTSMIDTYMNKHGRDNKLTFVSKILEHIQMNLQDIGSDVSNISIPSSEKNNICINTSKCSYDEQIKIMEHVITLIDKQNIPLKNFILPGGHKIASKIFSTSAYCRTIEPILVRATEKYNLNEKIQMYINRLSDLLFVFGRFINMIFNVSDIIYRRQ